MYLSYTLFGEHSQLDVYFFVDYTFLEFIVIYGASVMGKMLLLLFSTLASGPFLLTSINFNPGMDK